MNKEIEFKYKLSNLPNHYDQKLSITQIYFNPINKLNILKSFFPSLDFSSINTFRIRKIENETTTKYIITLKTSATGLSRFEYEKEIDENTYTSLSEDIESKIIKNRYIKIIDEYKFEFDEYLNLDVNLITVEIELKDESNIENDKKQIENILLKNGFTFEDVTFDNRYKNNNLTKFFKKEKPNEQ